MTDHRISDIPVQPDPTIPEGLSREARKYRNLNIPVSPGWNVTMGLPDPMSEVEWGQLHNVLAAMKPGIVAG